MRYVKGQRAMCRCSEWPMLLTTRSTASTRKLIGSTGRRSAGRLSRYPSVRCGSLIPRAPESPNGFCVSASASLSWCTRRAPTASATATKARSSLPKFAVAFSVNSKDEHEKHSAAERRATSKGSRCCLGVPHAATLRCSNSGGRRTTCGSPTCRHTRSCHSTMRGRSSAGG